VSKEACSATIVVPQFPAQAAKALRSAIAVDRAALAALDDADPLAARFRGARARAEQALGTFTGDPLRSGSMSPTATILMSARRVVAETRALRGELCS
jgi:hypothetical protein